MEWRKLAEEAIEGAGAGAGAGSYDVSRMDWHKALLYVFGAVAAMMAFLGFTSALLLCVWCRCRTNATAHANANGSGSGGGGGGGNMSSGKSVCDSEIGQKNCAQDDTKVLVVMPGHTLPTFIATLFLPHHPHAAAVSPPPPPPYLAAADAEAEPQPQIHPV